MKDKLMQINTEVEALQSDVKYKDKVLNKQRSEFLVSVRGRTRALTDLSKATILLRETQVKCCALLFAVFCTPPTFVVVELQEVSIGQADQSFTLVLNILGLQANAEEYVIELSKLEFFVTSAQREMDTTRRLYALEVTKRNQTGIALIDRNDELCILYEKFNVQVRSFLLQQNTNGPLNTFIHGSLYVSSLIFVPTRN